MARIGLLDGTGLGRTALLVAVTVSATAAGVAGAPAARAAAQTRYVAMSGVNTDNDCTLMASPCQTIQYAVDQANQGDTLSVAAGQYAESVLVRISLTIIGVGAGKTVISGDAVGDPGVLIDGTDTESPPTVGLRAIGVSDNPSGEGIEVTGATAHLVSVNAVHNSGDGLLLDSAGGDPSATATGSALSDNALFGVLMQSGTLTIGYSVVANNEIGGVAQNAGALQIFESTVYRNGQVGVGLSGSGPNLVANTTIAATAPAGDSPNAGLATYSAGTAKLIGTLITSGQTPACHGSSITDLGYNLSNDTSCGFSAAKHSHPHAAADLGSFGSHGGATQTLIPGLSSAARNQIPTGAANCIKGAPDQRGFARPQPVHGRCDIGAVEVQVVNPRIHVSITSSHPKVHGVYRGAVTVRFKCRTGTAPLVQRCPRPVHLRSNGRHHLTRTIHAKDGGAASVSVRLTIHKPK